MRPLRLFASAALLCAACRTPPPLHPAGPTLPETLDAARADAVLRPGDFLFRYVDPRDPLDSKISGAIIKAGQSAIQTTKDAIDQTGAELRRLVQPDDGALEQALLDGDPNAVHMAVYLGGGEAAEAFGTTPDNAAVNVWPLFAESRRNTAWRVFRHKDAHVAEAVARVARRWATGRMRYRMPFELFSRDGNWGDHARSAALEFAQSFETEGGPRSMNDMFCSQFAMAALQSAVVAVRFAPSQKPIAPAQLDTLPPEARFDASASPQRVWGEWVKSGAFDFLGRFTVP